LPATVSGNAKALETTGNQRHRGNRNILAAGASRPTRARRPSVHCRTRQI